MNKLNLDRDLVDECREMAESIIYPIGVYVNRHSTVSVERAILRLLGFEGSSEVQGAAFPVANQILDRINRRDLGTGAASFIASIKQKNPRWPQDKMAEKIIRGEVNCERLDNMTPETAHEILKPWIDDANTQLDRARSKHGEHRARARYENHFTRVNVSVGTGHVDQDADLVSLAASLDANGIEITRSSGQSLLNYVPQGTTTEGYGGTFVTQENMRVMREATARACDEYRHHITLTANAVGLCSPEIVAMGALERLDSLVSDALSAVLLRDINMKRAFIDEYFARALIARAGMGVMSATSDYVFRTDYANTLHHTVASLFINESFAKHAGLWDEKIGLAFSASFDEPVSDVVTNEWTFALLVKELFPRCTLKYVNASPRKAPEAWNGSVKDEIYQLIGFTTEQDILQIENTGLQGTFLPEKIQRIKSARWLREAGLSLGEEVAYSPNGKIMRQGRQILERTQKLLKQVSEQSLFDCLEDGLFLNTPRAKDQGRGFEGVFERARNYFNPFIEVSATANRR